MINDVEKQLREAMNGLGEGDVRRSIAQAMRGIFEEDEVMSQLIAMVRRAEKDGATQTGALLGVILKACAMAITVLIRIERRLDEDSQCKS